MTQVLWLIVIIAATGTAQTEDMVKLFDTNPLRLSRQAPDEASNDSSELKIFRGPRHDEFDWALTKKVLDNNNQNSVVSPFLVKLLLTILGEAAGQGTSTQKELLSVLPSLRDEAEMRQLYGRQFGSLLQESTDYELNLGAKLYVDKLITPRQKFVAIIESYYYSDIEVLDFKRSQEAANIINAWCANVTENHIKDIVSPEDVEGSVIMLLNTIYFNGFWTEPFAENDTSTKIFWLNSRSGAESQFMTKTANFYYGESTELGAKILRLPYKGEKLAMYIVLPTQIDGLDELISRVDSSNIYQTLLLMNSEEIEVLLPKFSIVNTIKLNEALKSLGIRQMFTSQASLPQLVRGPQIQDRLQVSSVLQKTGIEVNEKGSTAYEAKGVSIDHKIGAEIEFKADRPFLFFIIDETTGTLIFSGKFVRPA